MKVRVLTSVVALALFVPFCIMSSSPAFVFPLFTLIVSVIAAYEILHCVGYEKKAVVALPVYLTAATGSVLVRAFNDNTKFLWIMSLVYFTFMFVMLVISTFSRGKLRVHDIMTVVVMTVYVSFAFSTIVLLRDMELIYPGADETPIILGKYLYLLIFIFSWCPDIGGYFAGRAFGKHKLIPDVSPKKTVEGLFGGIILSVIAAVIYAVVLGTGTDDISLFYVLATAGAVTALISVCGDLIASLVKRQYGIKDYGFVFPGHGGILDRFDSVVAVAPFLYIMFNFVNSMGWLSGIAEVLLAF